METGTVSNERHEIRARKAKSKKLSVNVYYCWRVIILFMLPNELADMQVLK